MHLEVKDLVSVTKSERQQLNRLTLKSSGVEISLMRTAILQRTHNLHQVTVFLLKNTKGRIVAWSSVIRPPKGSCPIYTYVMKRYRRQGFGTRLLKAASGWVIKRGCKPRVYAWDAVSNKFFTAQRGPKISIMQSL